MTGTHHYIAILAQKDLFPPEAKPKPRKTTKAPAAKPASNSGGK